MATEQFSGPVDYLVFAFDSTADIGPGLASLIDRVNQGIVEILDVELITRDSFGAPQKLAFTDLPGITEVDPALFEGAESDILETDDLVGIAEALDEGQVAIALVYEDRSLAAAANAWTTAGATELFSGGIDVAELDRVLTERNPA